MVNVGIYIPYMDPMGLVNELVVEPTHLKNMLVKFRSFPPSNYRDENKKYLKPPPSKLTCPPLKRDYFSIGNISPNH